MRLILKSTGSIITAKDGLYLEDGTKLEGVQDVSYTRPVGDSYGTLDIRIENVKFYKGEKEIYFEIDSPKKQEVLMLEWSKGKEDDSV